MIGRVRLGVAARLAHREIRRRPRRHVLVVLLIFVPSLLTVLGFAGVATFNDVEARRADFERESLSGPARTRWWQTHEWIAGKTPHPAGVGPLPVQVMWLGGDDEIGQRAVSERFRVMEGREPEHPGEVLVTAAVAEEIGVSVGDRADLATPDGDVTVVGIGNRASDAFAFEVLFPAGTMPSEAAHPHRLDEGDMGNQSGPEAASIEFDARFTTIAVVGLSVLAVLTATLTSVAFAVASRSQLRTIGLLGAAGGDPATARASLVLQGLLPGLLGAGLAVLTAALLVTLGNIVDLSWGSRFAAPGTEGASTLARLSGVDGARFRFSGIGAVSTLLLGVTSGVLAAWFPARSVSRLPVLTALGARRPLPPVRREIPVGGAALFGVGLALLWIFARGPDHAELAFLVPLSFGLLVVGVVGITSALIAIVGRLADRVPGIGRIALRDLTRARGQTVGAVVAVSVCLAIPVGILTAANHNRERGRGCCAGTEMADQAVIPDDGSTAGAADLGRGPGDILAIDPGDAVSAVFGILDDRVSETIVHRYLTADGNPVKVGRIEPAQIDRGFEGGLARDLHEGRAIPLRSAGVGVDALQVGSQTIPIRVTEPDAPLLAETDTPIDLLVSTEVVPAPTDAEVRGGRLLLREGRASAIESERIRALDHVPGLEALRARYETPRSDQHDRGIWFGSGPTSTVMVWSGWAGAAEYGPVAPAPWWRHPRVVGTAAAALAATIVSSIALVLRDLDRHTDRRGALAAGADPRRLRRIGVLDASIVTAIGAVIGVVLGWVPTAVILTADRGFAGSGPPSPGRMGIALVVLPTLSTAFVWAAALRVTSRFDHRDGDILVPRVGWASR